MTSGRHGTSRYAFLRHDSGEVIIMTQSWRFRVDGLPIPQGSMKAMGSASTGRPIVRPSNAAALARWRADIAEAARRAQVPRLDGPVHLTAWFKFARPKSHYGKRGVLPSAPRAHTQRPDLDKLIRAVGDALTGVAFGDDSQIVSIEASKSWTPSSGVGIELSQIGGLGFDPGEKHESGVGDNGTPTGEPEAPTHQEAPCQ